MIHTATDYIYCVQINFYCQIILLKILIIFKRCTHTPSACSHTYTTSLDHSYFSDREAFRKCKLQYPKNSATGYLNINSLRNKSVGLREIMSDNSLDYFVVSETRLDSSFPSAQFHTNGSEVRARRDRGKSGGELIEFVRKGFICKRLKKIEPKYSEVICSEFKISDKKWIYFSAYRPPT